MMERFKLFGLLACVLWKKRNKVSFCGRVFENLILVKLGKVVWKMIQKVV